MWPAAVIAGIVAGTATYTLREALYEAIELPLYNMWLGIHTYLAMTGYLMPMTGEINSGLNTLGVSVANDWQSTIAALGDPDGGFTPGAISTDPSGGIRTGFPKDVVLDPPGAISGFAQMVTAGGLVVNGEYPSEFTRPWLFPTADNQGDAVFVEQKASVGGPFVTGMNATALFGASPGTANARAKFEAAQNEAETIAAAATLLPAGEHLGDPKDFTTYLVARLTRDDLDPVQTVNFDLDADRGYGYLAWDLLRFKDRTSSPSAFRGSGDPGHGGAVTDVSQRLYFTPVKPGYGWNPADQLNLGGQPPLVSFDPGRREGERSRSATSAAKRSSHDREAPSPLVRPPGPGHRRRRVQAAPRSAAQGACRRCSKEGGRANRFLPYLLIRSVLGDRGDRPINVPFWESPDIWTAPGDPATSPAIPPDHGGTLNAGQPNTIYAHVWNLGFAPLAGVRVEFYWFDPSVSIDGSHAHLIGMTRCDLASRGMSGSHMLVKCPTAWVPVVVNGGHECLVVRVEGVGDPIGANPWAPWQNRHVAQRNISVVATSQNIAHLIASLNASRPLRARLQLVQVGTAEATLALKIASAPHLRLATLETHVLGEINEAGRLTKVAPAQAPPAALAPVHALAAGGAPAAPALQPEGVAQGDPAGHVRDGEARGDRHRGVERADQGGRGEDGGREPPGGPAVRDQRAERRASRRRAAGEGRGAGDPGRELSGQLIGGYTIVVAGA